MQTPGVNHVIDNAIRDAVQRLEWFPEFLRGLKAIARFCRRPHYVQSMVVFLQSNGHGDAAKKLVGFCANFAKWRWRAVLPFFPGFLPLH